jgi:hypothetical protein
LPCNSKFHCGWPGRAGWAWQVEGDDTPTHHLSDGEQAGRGRGPFQIAIPHPAQPIARGAGEIQPAAPIGPHTGHEREGKLNGRRLGGPKHHRQLCAHGDETPFGEGGEVVQIDAVIGPITNSSKACGVELLER